jgi:hypothetical protein
MWKVHDLQNKLILQLSPLLSTVWSAVYVLYFEGLIPDYQFFSWKAEISNSHTRLDLLLVRSTKSLLIIMGRLLCYTDRLEDNRKVAGRNR